MNKDKLAFLVGFAFTVIIVAFWLKEHRDRVEMERQLAQWQAEDDWTLQLLEMRAMEAKETFK